ncbi:MAG: phosphoribosylformylglycinamidine cyclo-ligase [Candidatus Aminicenantaceae bacterium]
MTALTYKKAGVDIDKADTFLEKIKPLLQKTSRPEVLGKVGGFSGFFQPRLQKLKDPVLVSATDGVGTKLLLADLQGKYDTVGIDLVAMCVNDVVVTGAEPLLFLDYIACGQLNIKRLHELMKGIAKGCQMSGCALIGGETAELPGMYTKDKLDLAGFCVGMVSREKIIDGKTCRKGDKVLGLASSGVHSNGFSLIRKVFNERELRGLLGRELLKPTRIYVKPLLRLFKHINIKGLAHITGGGFFENIPRTLPPHLSVRIQKGAWHVPPIFRKIQSKGRITDREMFRTFNMGVGMVMILSPRSVARSLHWMDEMGLKAWVIGDVTEGNEGVLILD